MNRQKRILLLAFLTAAVMVFTCAVTATNGWKNVDILYSDIKINLNGHNLTPKDVTGRTVEPFIIDGTTYLPVRALSQSLGLKVDWDGATSTVLLKGASQTAALTPTELYREMLDSVVHLDTGFSGGTGFFIEEDIVVTNNHVIDGAWGIRARTADGREMNVTHILAKSTNPDLAILKVDGKGKPVTVASGIEEVGGAAYSIGAPLGIFPTFSGGMILNNTFREQDISFYLTNIGTLSGNSGGPVFNDRGEVIGVVQGGMGDGSNTMDMMIQIAHISDLDRSNPIELTGKEPLPEDSMTKAASLETAEIGQLVSFGHYEQDNDPATTDEEIAWIVLDKNEDGLKLMSLYVLDCMQMMDSDEPYSWENSAVRAFLNGEFTDRAFTDVEKARLRTATVANTPNPIHGTEAGPDTEDKVYLMNLEEALAFYGIDELRETFYDGVFAHATEYTSDKGVWLEIPGSSKCWWWLRSAGGNEFNAAEIGSAGYMSFNGSNAAGEMRGLRPVIHVSLGN